MTFVSSESGVVYSVVGLYARNVGRDIIIGKNRRDFKFISRCHDLMTGEGTAQTKTTAQLTYRRQCPNIVKIVILNTLVLTLAEISDYNRTVLIIRQI